MNLFEVNKDFEIEVDPKYVATVPELKAIYSLNYNKTKGDHAGRKREKAKKELVYVYLMYNYSSPVANYEFEDRRRHALKNARLEPNHKVSKELKSLIDCYISVRDSDRSMRSLMTARSLTDKTIDFLENINIKEKKENGEYIHKVSDVIKHIKELKDLQKELKEFEDKVKKELSSTGRIRGDVKKGNREDPK